MRTSNTFAALAALLCLAFSCPASADTPPPAAGAAPRDTSAGPTFDERYIVEVNRRARGVGLGLDQGYWGSGFGQSLRVDVPFHPNFGARARGVIAYGPGTMDTFDPAVFGAVELFGRSPVMLGLARMYGGGGVFVGGRPNPADDEGSFGVSGGGHLGIELFLLPRYSFSVEVGGQGGVHELGLDTGASVMGGMTFYVGG